MRVTSSGLPSDNLLCTRCYEKLCAREWRAEVWTRWME